jgi:hypothetical protein
MIISNEYPPEEYENECDYCGEECNGKFCSKSCKKAYEED